VTAQLFPSPPTNYSVLFILQEENKSVIFQRPLASVVFLKNSSRFSLFVFIQCTRLQITFSENHPLVPPVGQRWPWPGRKSIKCEDCGGKTPWQEPDSAGEAHPPWKDAHYNKYTAYAKYFMGT